MKFLLTAVNAKYIHSNPAVYSLKSYAGERFKDFIDIAEYTINQRMETILAGIFERRPDAIAFSCYIWNWELIQELLEEIPKVLPGIPIWLGGPEVSFNGEEIMKKYPQLTGIMIGEGEQTFKELIEYYVCEAERRTESQNDNKSPGENRDTGEGEKTSENRDYSGNVNESKELSRIAGLLLAGGKTEERGLTDMDSLPFLYEDMEAFDNRIIYYESSRGCPYRCSYCLSSIDKKVRLRDLETVKRELQFFLDQKTAQVKFIDRTFNCDHEHAMGIWRYIIQNDNGVTNFHFEIEGNILTKEEIELLQEMRPGLAQLEIGVQSANPATLKEINRFTDFANLKNAVKMIRKKGNIHLHLDLIAGLPFEDYNSFSHSFNEVYGLHPDQLQLGFLKVLKGSPMQDKADEYGILYTNKPPYEILCSKWLSYQDVLRLKRIEEMVEIYYNSNQFMHTLSFLESAFVHPFAMFEGLAQYYQDKGYFTNSPSRAYRYEILLGFAQCVDQENEALYRELLIFDMYLRENLKSRPSFAGETEDEEKCRIREFYEKEASMPCYLKAYAGFSAKQTSKMTHMEPFSYPVWLDGEKIKESVSKDRTAAESGPKKRQLVLFDYKKRNPLHSEAAVYLIEG